MGNGGQKYLSPAEARDILGEATWNRLRKQLEKYRVKFVDFEIFDGLLRNRFGRMVSSFHSILM
jgi:hypothetical protein